ncbi:MAG TPA: secondary thiamine-phosphate synthase enzyme YjbQ [Chthoniobacterales bacterium]|nr:secondary thiamine-phosphate synthase enzyme YjbQ [Chthoniobacterales bacterium]
MRARSDRLQLRTRGKGTYEFTDELQSLVTKHETRTGLVTAFVRHTSCSLVMMENAAPAARRDLERFFDELVPESRTGYEHDDEGPDDMPAHIRMALTRTSETIPIASGKLQLGTWQGIFLFEHRSAPHTRHVEVTIIGE